MCWFQNSKPAPSVVVITATPWSTSLPFPGTWPFTSFPASAPSVAFLRRLVFLSSIVVRIGAVFTHFFLIWRSLLCGGCVRHVQFKWPRRIMGQKGWYQSPSSLYSVNARGSRTPSSFWVYKISSSLYFTLEIASSQVFFDACSISWFIQLG